METNFIKYKNRDEATAAFRKMKQRKKIGRASCRERV